MVYSISVQAPTRNTSFLVVGQDGVPLGEDGAPTANLLRARKLVAEGYSLEIINEDAFLNRIGLVEQEAGVHRRYTIVQLSRILSVPRDRIRAWMRAGLIEPVETVHRLAHFDYQQVSTAKMLYDLVTSGLTPGRIREGLQRLQRWLPGVDRQLSQLSVLESHGKLLVRLDDGRLVEPTGQLQFDFDSAAEQPELCVIDAESKPAETWFHEAVAHEDGGRFEEALIAYGEAARQEPDDPVLQFNLANVLYSLGRLDEAITHFQRAVGLDTTYVEAWNNLGSILAEQDDVDEAVIALQYALHLVPTYADAHFNLAAILAANGRSDEACEHWRAYLRLDPASPWAEEARKNLAGALQPR